jgi:hypothetical protein
VVSSAFILVHLNHYWVLMQIVVVSGKVTIPYDSNGLNWKVLFAATAATVFPLDLAGFSFPAMAVGNGVYLQFQLN